jgi:hypothetical protein
LHLCRIWGLAWNCHLHIVMILLHMTFFVCWVELVELRAKLLGIFWCCWLALSNLQPNLWTFRFCKDHNTHLFSRLFLSWKEIKTYVHSEKTYIDVFEWM